MWGITTSDNELASERNEATFKIEVNDDDPIIPFNSESEITDEPNLCVFELKSELITNESEIIPDSENSFFSLKQPEQNPYVLIKRLTSEEIQRACVPQGGLIIKVEKHGQNQPSSTVGNISVKDDLQFECKLCSKQLQSDGQLKIHVGICALNHEDQNRFCVICNRKFCDPTKLKDHRLRFHGTEEERSSLFKFKCHLCPKKYQREPDLTFHLNKSHKGKKEKVETSTSKLPKCPHPNCGKEFGFNYILQRHISAVHSGPKSFSCSFQKCNRKFSQKAHLEKHVLTHTKERPYKCTVDNCNRAFATFSSRSIHHRNTHRNLLNE